MKPFAAVVADFDGIADAIAADDRSDALTPAERFVLGQVPSNARRALDVGCGDGALTRALAARGISTIGIDASPRMIAVAKARSEGSALLEYRVHDITSGKPPGTFDVVVSVAMAHHAPLERVIEYLRAAVAPGGTLLIQDVTTRRGIFNFPVNALAWLARRLRLVTGRENCSKNVEGLYAMHGSDEQYLQQSEVSRVYRSLLPGAEVHHHLEWRYTVIWRAPHA